MTCFLFQFLRIQGKRLAPLDNFWSNVEATWEVGSAELAATARLSVESKSSLDTSSLAKAFHSNSAHVSHISIYFVDEIKIYFS
jgi:hypothetical protein